MRENRSGVSGPVNLEPVDTVQVTILADNFVDILLQGPPGISRLRDRGIDEAPLAVHGLSLLIEITRDRAKSRFLLDTGPSEFALGYNLEKMGVDLRGLSGIFLSHNHRDHTTGLEAVLAITGPVPVFIHPYGFYTKWIKDRASRLDKNALAGQGALWRAEEGPQPMAPFLWTTGSIPRITEFEEMIGSADRRVERNGVMEPETFPDDGALVMRVKDKGLVIVTGCAHSGIINTLRHGQKLGGNEKIHAVIGGFHLTQASPERISKTIEALAEKEIKYLVPLHCNGFEAMASMWQAFPYSFVVPSVGTRIEL